MKYVDFQIELERAKKILSENPDYWIGYQMGLLRNYYGEISGGDKEHRDWLEKVESTDEYTKERGKGYIDGFNFK